MKRREMLGAVAMISALACSKRSHEASFEYGEANNRYTLHGVVLRLRPETRIAVIKHEKIDGWMEAMTMDFPVPDASEYAKLKEGVHVSATVCVNDLYFWLTDIRLEH